MKTKPVYQNELINFRIQKLVVFVAFLLFFIKIYAWILTDSVAIYSDALESVVNLISSLLGLYSLYLTTKPKDEEHPYGHGKIEFVSAGLEGLLIGLAGIMILFESVQNIFHPKYIHQIDYGILLIVITAIINFGIGIYAIRKGKKHKSLVLQSTGKHLLTDTYSTVGITVGLLVIYFTKVFWIDSIVGMLTSCLILYTSYRIVRESIGGIMDEADKKLIREIVIYLEEKREKTWIDIHNLRVIKYGPKFHMDVHLTLPYYQSVEEAHLEMENINHLLDDFFGDQVELFIHPDPCESFSCPICTLDSCQVRKTPFEKKIEWTYQNVARNTKHQLM